MVVETTVIKRFKPFKLGVCLCGCNEEHFFSRGDYLRRYVNGHNTRLRLKELHPQWKGGRRKIKTGYIMKRAEDGHPRANKDKEVMEHILVYEKYLSIVFDEDIYIPPIGYHVHHINGKRDDNRLVNLELLSNVEHIGMHKMGNQYWRKRKLRNGRSIVGHNENSQARLEFQ